MQAAEIIPFRHAVDDVGVIDRLLFSWRVEELDTRIAIDRDDPVGAMVNRQRGKPFGSSTRPPRTAKTLGLESTLRSRGRPRKQSDGLVASRKSNVTFSHSPINSTTRSRRSTMAKSCPKCLQNQESHRHVRWLGPSTRKIWFRRLPNGTTDSTMNQFGFESILF